MPDITSLLPLDQIELDQEFENKETCIDYLIDLIDDNENIEDKEQVKADIIKRESQTTTGVGKGIGIPHAKTSGVKKPTVAFVRSTNGVDFGAMDEKPARLIFMLLVPEKSNKEHLKLLSSLSRALVHEDVRQSLYKASTPKKVLTVLDEAMNK